MSAQNQLRLLCLAAVCLAASGCGLLGDLFGGGGRDQDSEVERMVYVRGDEIHSSWLRTARLEVLQEEGNYSSPVFSPNGRKIAYLAIVPPEQVGPGSTDDVFLAVMSDNGGNVVTLYNGNVTHNLIKWTLTGNHIQFIEGNTILRVNVEGGVIDTLGQTPSSQHLHWSPAGDRLFYSLWSDGWHLGYVDIAGGSAVDLQPDTSRNDLFPVVSPDGNEIAYVSEKDGISELWVYDLRTDLRRQVSGPPVVQRMPVWSSDGSQIAFVKSTNIFIVNADGTGEQQLTTRTANYRLVAWSPKGTEIIYNANISSLRVVQNSIETYLLTVETRSSEEVLDVGDDVNILWKN